MLFGVTPPSYTIGSSKRQIHDISPNPGPAAYETTTSLKKQSPKPVFGTASRHFYSKSMSPGPGTYTLQSSMGSGPKPTIPPTTQPLRPTDRLVTPGPGSYQPLPPQSRLRYSFGSSPRMVDHCSATPGPGAYRAGLDVLKTSPRAK